MEAKTPAPGNTSTDPDHSWRSRRLWFAWSTELMCLTLAWAEKIDGGNFTAITIALITGYYGNRAITEYRK